MSVYVKKIKFNVFFTNECQHCLKLMLQRRIFSLVVVDRFIFSRSHGWWRCYVFLRLEHWGLPDSGQLITGSPSRGWGLGGPGEETELLPPLGPGLNTGPPAADRNQTVVRPEREDVTGDLFCPSVLLYPSELCWGQSSRGRLWDDFQDMHLGLGQNLCQKKQH